MNSRRSRSFAALALLATAMAACGPGGSGAAPQPAPTATSPAVPTATSAAMPTPTSAPEPATPAAAIPAFDQQFIDMMVPHHEGALGMARIAQQRAERPEIRQMADDILRSQDAEISQMRQWRREWFGSSATPPMDQMPTVPGMAGMNHAGMTMDMAADVQRLRVAPSPFDLAFIDAMIPHHQSAIEASRVALKESSRQEIQDLALAIMEAQQREIGQMRSWRLSWSQSGASATPVTKPATETEKPSHMVPGEDMNH
jgi:uncharacterized protein (DUF305 family)